MALVEQHRLSDGLSVVELRFDRNPAMACPGGEISAMIYVLTGRRPQLRNIDDFFDVVDIERRVDGLVVNNRFPVFMANLAGARVVVKPESEPQVHFIDAIVKLGYCASTDPYLAGDTELFLTHSPAEHRADVVDTLVCLAEFALGATVNELPGLQSQEHRTPLLDQ